MMFDIKESVICACHGAGEVVDIRKEDVCGDLVDMFVIKLFANNMLISVPFSQAKQGMLRSILKKEEIIQELGILRKKAKPLDNVIWNKRINAYKLKVNSGSMKLIAEIIRDLYKSFTSGSLSHSEKVMYQDALGKLCDEISLSFIINDKDMIAEELTKILEYSSEGIIYKSALLGERDLESVTADNINN